MILYSINFINQSNIHLMLKKLKIFSVVLVALFFFLTLVGTTVGALQRPNPNNEKVDVLVNFHQMPTAAEQGLIHRFGGEINRTYNNFPVIAARLPQKAIDALEQHSTVRLVELDQEVHALYEKTDEYANPWGIKHIQADLAHDNNYLGETIKVAVIDSGVDYTHRDLSPNFNSENLGADFVENDGDPMDVYGHGTHVAGSIAAAQDGFGVVGVAPKVQIIALRILNDDGVGSESNTLAALDWIITYNTDNHEAPIRITNNSYGRGSSSSPLKDAFDILATKYNVLHVAAAGNSGNPAGKNDSVIYPAKYTSVMAIAAINSSNQRPNWSSTGPDVELTAPGVSVLSTWNSSTSYANPQPICFEDNGCHYYKEGSGTSMASPHVAGAAALVWGTDTSFLNAKVRQILQQSAQDIGLSSLQQGHGLVRADSAVELATSGELEPAPTYSISGTVTDTENNPLENAAVSIVGTELTVNTNSDGSYSIQDVSEGTYDIEASKDGYETQSKTIKLNSDQTVDFSLQKTQEDDTTDNLMTIGSIIMWSRSAGPNRFVNTEIKILDESGNPVSDALVEIEIILPDTSKTVLTELTDSNGVAEFQLKSRQTGDYTSTVQGVSKDGWTWDGIQAEETITVN